MPETYMLVKKVDEAGYNAALHGLAHNKKQPIAKMSKVAQKLADLDGGHNKFLESIYVWLDVCARDTGGRRPTHFVFQPNSPKVRCTH